MDFALVYIIERFFYRFIDFFHHWYVDASRRFAHTFIVSLENMDQTFAVKITLKYFFHPLYKDYSVIGRVLGIIFRSLRIIIGIAVYIFWTAIFAALYLAWALVIPVLIFYAFRSF